MAPGTSIHSKETKENGQVKRKWKTIIEVIGMWSLANFVIYSPSIYEDALVWLHYAFFLFMSFYSHKESFPWSSFGAVAYGWMAGKTLWLKLVFTMTWYNRHYTLMAITFMELLQLTIYDGVRTKRVAREIRLDYQFTKGSLPESQPVQVNNAVYKKNISCGILGVVLKRDAIVIKSVSVFIVLLYITAPYVVYMLIANIPSIIFVMMIIFIHADFFSEKPLVDFILYCCVMLKYAFYLRYILTLQLNLHYLLLIMSLIEYFQMYVSHRIQAWLCDREIVKCRQCSDKNVGTHRNSKRGRLQSDLSFIEEIFFFCIFICLILYFNGWVISIVTIRDIFLVIIPLLVIAYSSCFLVANKALLSLKYSHVFCLNFFKCVLFIDFWISHILPKCLILFSIIELCQMRVIGYHILEKKVMSAPELCECGRLNKCIICLVWSLMPYTYSVDFWRVMSCVTSYVASYMTSYVTFVDASRVTSYMHFVDVWYRYKIYSRHTNRDDSEVV